MNQISKFPKIIGTYEVGRAEFEVYLEDDLKAFFPEIHEEEINNVLEAVRQNTFTLLPDGFQGGRDNSNSGLFVLYTTR